MHQSLGLFDTPTQSSDSFAPRDLLRLMFKHKLVILTCFVAVTAAVAWGILSLPPTYTSNAKLWVEIEQGSNPTFFSGIAAFREPNTEAPANRTIETEMELIETWPIAAEAVSKLGLTYDQVYHSPLTHLLRPASDLYDTIVTRWFGWPRDPDKRGFADTVAEFQKSLEVRPLVSKTSDTNSNIIGLTLRGTSPELARKSLDAVVQAFTDTQSKLYKQRAEKAYAVVGDRVQEARAEVNAAQRRLETFLAQTAGPTYTNASAAPAGKPPRVADAGLVPSLPGSALAAGTRALTTPRDVTTLANLKAHLLNMEVQLVSREHLFPGQSGQTEALRSSIATLGQQLDREQRASARDEAGLTGLDRELRVREASLTSLETRLSQIGMFLDMNAGQINNRVLVEPPLKPRSSDWKRRAIVVVAGAVGGLFLGLALAGFRELTDQRLETEKDVKQHLGLAVSGMLPLVRSSTRRRALNGAGLLASPRGTVRARTV